MCSNSQMTDAARQAFLNAHNSYRSQVAQGRARDAMGGYAPRAADMLKLKYDCNIEAQAISHASRCQFQHSRIRGLGENIFYSSNPRFDKASAAKQASDMWFGELATNGVGQNPVFSMSMTGRPMGKMIGHYTQMVWSRTNAIGCAVQNCRSSTIAVCNYKQQGNVLSQPIYKVGAACSACPGGTRCENSLCA